MAKGRKPSHPDMEKALNDGDGGPGDDDKGFRLFGVDSGPQLYRPPKNLVTPPLIAKNLPRVFEVLPIYGKPDPGMTLNRFIKNKLKLFLGVTDKQFKQLSKMCSPDQLKTGNELVMDPMIPDQLLMNVHAEPRMPLHADADPPQLKILERNKENKEEDDKEECCFKNALKYKYVHLIPLEQQARSLNGNPTSQPAEPVGVPKKASRSGRCKSHARGKSSATANFKTFPAKASPAPAGANKPAPGAVGDVDPAPDEGNEASSAPDEQLTPGKDILLKVRIYKPFDYEEYKNKSDGSLYNLFYHDLVLTGRNKVSDIKDNFICSEKGSTKESSRNGFLFIKNEFYIDYGEKAADHADSLRQWCAMRDFGDFPKHDMRECKLNDLEYKLGNPDVYIHDTSCEHIIIFSEIRLLNANDPLHLSDYPRITSKSLHQWSPFCYSCAQPYPKWIVSGCTRLPFNMAFFCQDCLKKLLYDDTGKKVCKFKAYPYKGGEQKN